MRTHQPRLLGAVVVVVAVLAGGCGGYGGSKSKAGSSSNSTSTQSSAGGSVIKTVTVHEKEYKLTPSTIALAKTGTYVFKSVNGTAASPTWTQVDTNGIGLPNRSCKRIAIDPANNNRVYVTFSGYQADPPPPSAIVYYDGKPFVNMVFTNSVYNLLGVGWLEPGRH